ncbi:hypothetical protein QCA50_004966 [Cerrena zonata]|uniref:Secreted protein n=1 Tax=Cerrena zonata TaxID=2478898 RepID=A0AAW0GG27_9APHY
MRSSALPRSLSHCWFMALYSLAGSRLILNLRMAAAKSKPDSTTSEQTARTRHTDYDVDLGTIFTFQAGESSFNTSIPC